MGSRNNKSECVKLTASHLGTPSSISNRDTTIFLWTHPHMPKEACPFNKAFDAMKGELQTAQHRNAYKKRSFYEKSDIGENFVATKREADENGGDTVRILAEPFQQTKKLPVGIRNIRQILEEGYMYVDKTNLIFDLMLEHNFDYFMVRPKGFGKTLFLSTLEEIFKGNKQLFKGTEIHRSKYKWVKFPVLRFDFSRVEYCRDPNKFETALKKEVKKMMKENGVAPVGEGDVDLKSLIKQLVEELSKKSGARVVILVDEYDAPITNSLADVNITGKCRDILSNFLSVVTSLSDDFLQFTFVTGVNQFSVCGPQGCGDDHLVDITLNPRYATMMGFTKEELEINLASYIPENKSQIPTENILSKAKEHCNSYRFTENEVSVYNPLSILTYLNTQNVESHLYPEKIPRFLIESIRNDPQIIFNLQNSATEGFSLQLPIDISKKINLEPFLFQMGYLTIRGYRMRDNWGYYELDFQNENIKNTFFRVALKGLTELDPVEIVRDGDKMKQDLAKLDVNSFIATLQTHISSIPIQLRQNATLEYYRAIFYLLMKNYGFEIKMEFDYSITKTSNIVTLFKFILNQSADTALARLLEMQESKDKKKLCVGVNFHVEASNINDWKAVLTNDGKVIKEFLPRPE